MLIPGDSHSSRDLLESVQGAQYVLKLRVDMVFEYCLFFAFFFCRLRGALMSHEMGISLRKP